MHMRFAQVCAGMMVTAATAALAAPTRVARAINCEPTDDDGAALTGSSVDSANSFATCSYKDAGECTYFFADGSFSSGSSTCPKGLPQNAASSGTGGSGGGSTGGSNAGTGSSSSGSISANVNCEATDDDGTALTASSVDSANSFATCSYKDAGDCTYFFADGSFSSGSSTCPKGLPQTGGGGSGGAATTTTPPAQETTTAAPPPPPPATTTSTPPPPETTTSTPPPPETTTSTPEPPPVTSTETSTSTSTETITSSPTSTTQAAQTTPVAPPPAAPTTTDNADTTTVFVDPSPSPSPTDGVANSANGGLGNTGAAPRTQAVSGALTAVPLLLAAWTLL